MKRVALVALVACGTDAPLVEPVYVLPVDDPDATPSGLAELTLGVARAGSAVDLVAASFAPGAAITLDDLPYADDLVLHLSGRIGASDVAYGRSCTFALQPGSALPAPHLLFARAVKFVSFGVTARSRAGDVGAAFGDGSALITGEGGAERFDPRTGALTPLADDLAPRTGGLAVPFGLGDSQQVALLGGASDRVELVARDGRVDRLADARLARPGAPATALTDGRIVILGGTETLELASTDSGPELRTRGGLAAARTGATATRLGDDVGAPVLVVGGLDAGAAPVLAAALYRPLAGAFSSFAPASSIPRHRHAAVLLPDGSVLVAGGLDAANQPVRTLERFTLDGGFEILAAPLPETAGVVGFTATVLPDGRVLLAGGTTTEGGLPTAAAFIARLDVVDGTVDIVATDALAVPRAAHSATLLCDGTVLVAGGTAEAALLERYNPPASGRR